MYYGIQYVCMVLLMRACCWFNFLPGEKDASHVGWGEESALQERKMGEIFCQQLHARLVSTWCSASLGN